MTSATAAPPSTTAAISRWLAGVFPDAPVLQGERPLELAAQASEPPRLKEAKIIEAHAMRARAVSGPPVVGFAAFLDGRQESTPLVYRPGGVPIVLGAVGAVIRERRNQRLYTWDHLVERALYVSRSHLSKQDWEALSSGDLPLRNSGGEDDIEHPLALRESASQRVEEDRKRVEQRLARAWCERESRPLLIDGGISDAEPIARSECAIGVIKSHRTLYARGEALATVLGLGAGERSSAFLVEAAKRASVASWYLRIHDPRGHDPMWGLVRVEVAAPPGGREDDISSRADEVSRWILAEGSPVALPDGRWDKMVYGVRDCEEFLRAVM